MYLNGQEGHFRRVVRGNPSLGCNLVNLEYFSRRIIILVWSLHDFSHPHHHFLNCPSLRRCRENKKVASPAMNVLNVYQDVHLDIHSVHSLSQIYLDLNDDFEV